MTRSRMGRRGRTLALGGFPLASILLVACVDLFHSTDFSSACGASCSGEGGTDATKHDGGNDAGTDGRPPGKDGGADATVDAPGPHRDAKGSETGKGPAETGPDSPTHVPDTGVDAGMDAGRDFCSGSGNAAAYEATAANRAVNACRWLGGCTNGFNDYGACYVNALLAYDCILNPNQKVSGTLHTYWDKLWQATSCADVFAALPGGKPACTANATSCGTGEAVDVAFHCDGASSLVWATNCDAIGYTCQLGQCVLPAASCGATVAGSPPPACAGTVLHACQNVERDGGPAVVDVGKNCAHFGAGACVATADAGFGCVPNGATACGPSDVVQCSGDASATSCATGHPETVNCASFGLNVACGLDGGHVASGAALSGACYSRSTSETPSCLATSFTDNAGASGPVSVTCPSVTGVGCELNTTNNEPYCTGLP